jgi:hypothetical protein
MTALARVWLGALMAFVASCVLGAAAASAQPAANPNLADFDFVVATVEPNYSGWPTKTEGARGSELAKLAARLRADVAAGDDAALQQAVTTWLVWFDDGHLQAQWNNGDTGKPWKVPRRPLSESAARGAIAALGDKRDPVEGLWTIDDRYRLAVLRRKVGWPGFDAVVLLTSAEGWRPGDTKAILNPRKDGGYDVRYGAGDKTEISLTARLLGRGDLLDLGELGIWRRAIDDPAAAEAALRRFPGDAFVLTRIDTQTLYLRLPSFSDMHTATVRDLIAANQADLAATSNLIIDVRNNGGGSDFVYDPVLPWIATRAIWRIGVDIRASPLNQRLRREIADQIAAASPDAARTLRAESERMGGAASGFIRREPPVEIVPFAAALPYPARVAVLIDGAGSSAENFIMDAR